MMIRTSRFVGWGVVAAVLLSAVASRGTPPVEPERWNTDDKMQQCNNCYNYATNYPNSTFALPGRAGGFQISPPFTCAEGIQAAEADGLQYAGDKLANTICPVQCCRVALVSSGRDLHWYREDSDGLWSHKLARADAMRVDAAGDPITDPSTANRNHNLPGLTGLDYSDFCGFLCVCRNHKPLQGSKPAKPIPANWAGCPPHACQMSPPMKNFPGCIEAGKPSDHACECCSCVLRITNPLGGGECRP